MKDRVLGCSGKRKFATSELAMAVHDRVVARRGPKTQQMYPYKCEHCGCWHVSSESPEKHAAKVAAILKHRREYAEGRRHS